MAEEIQGVEAGMASAEDDVMLMRASEERATAQALAKGKGIPVEGTRVQDVHARIEREP